MNIGFMGDGRNSSKKAGAFDELLASYDPIDYMYSNIDKQKSKSFIPTETECNDILGINALEKMVKMMRMENILTDSEYNRNMDKLNANKDKFDIT